MNDHNGQLRSIVERIVRLEEDKRGIADDIKDVYAEAKSNGFDVPALRDVVKLSLEDKAKRDKRENKEAIRDTYAAALGLLSGSIFEEAARSNMGAAQ